MQAVAQNSWVRIKTARQGRRAGSRFLIVGAAFAEF